jgi:hypothetical protein
VQGIFLDKLNHRLALISANQKIGFAWRISLLLAPISEDWWWLIADFFRVFRVFCG